MPVVQRSTDRNKQLIGGFVRFFFPNKEAAFFHKFLYTNTVPLQLNKKGKSSTPIQTKITALETKLTALDGLSTSISGLKTEVATIKASLEDAVGQDEIDAINFSLVIFSNDYCSAMGIGESAYPFKIFISPSAFVFYVLVFCHINTDYGLTLRVSGSRSSQS